MESHLGPMKPIPGFREIEFKSQGVTLRGRLYGSREASEHLPVIVMAHGFTTTINGMTADKYAERFQKAGCAVMLYDHRNLGISDGEPRQEINFWLQARGYIDAMDFLNTQPGIDTSRIAVWGVSMSAREAFLVGSVDERVKAIITLVPAFGEKYPSEDVDGSMFAFAKETLHADNMLKLPYSSSDRMPIVSHDQLGAPSRLKELTAYRWFLEYGGRYGTNWQNVVSISNLEVPEDFHVGQFAAHIGAPILMIVATDDEMEGANTEVTRDVFDRIKQPKKWVPMDGGHFGLLYHPSPLFEESCQSQIAFLEEHFNI